MQIADLVQARQTGLDPLTCVRSAAPDLKLWIIERVL